MLYLSELSIGFPISSLTIAFRLGARNLKIAVEEIREGVSTLELTSEPEEIGLESEDVFFSSPVFAELELFRQNDKVFVKARLTVTVELGCARCLTNVRRTLVGTLENQYRPLPKIARDIVDDIGIGYYSGEYIDLSDDFRESLLLELPAKVLCLEDCRGLCPQCGQNLNTGKCNCHLELEETQTSRFAELVKMLELDKKLEV